MDTLDLHMYLRDTEIQMKASGSRMDELDRLLRIALPPRGFFARDGKLTQKKLVIDTSKVRVAGTTATDLERERLRLFLRASGKDSSISQSSYTNQTQSPGTWV